MPALTYIISTARDDYPMVELPDLHLFEPTARSLEVQLCKDFELVVVDALHGTRPTWWEDRKVSFPVKHVPPKPGTWLDRGWWAVCGGFNTGLVHADGKYIMVLGDCCELPPEATSVLLGHFRAGRRPQMGFLKYYGGWPHLQNPTAETMERLVKLRERGVGPLTAHLELPATEVWGDLRYAKARQKPPPHWLHQDGSRFFGYSGCTMADALTLNGYDERLDGAKSLEDCDFGHRLSRLLVLAGTQPDFVLDRRLWVVEHEHRPCSEKVLPYRHPGFKTNYPFFLINRRRHRTRVNDRPFDSIDLAMLRTPPTCSTDPDEAKHAHYWPELLWDHPDFKHFLDHPPIFDLMSQRDRRVAGQEPWS